ncbi:MAG: hypothetical protein AAFQ80_18340 [Cyanobacteria bacterium J06621_8]
MKYIDLQQRLKHYQVAGLVMVKLNASKSALAAEYQRCLQLGLSQSDLLRLTAVKNYQRLDAVSTLEIQANPQSFPLRVIKAKTYQLGQVDNLQDLKLAFPIFNDSQYDFRTKISWSQCAYAIDQLTQDSQEFTQFKQDVRGFIEAIKLQQYHQLTGDNAVTEAADDLANYICWWKGAQWEYTLATKASTLDLLKRAWLEQYFAQHELKQLLKYSPIE